MLEVFLMDDIRGVYHCGPAATTETDNFQFRYLFLAGYAFKGFLKLVKK